MGPGISCMIAEACEAAIAAILAYLCGSLSTSRKGMSDVSRCALDGVSCREELNQKNLGTERS